MKLLIVSDVHGDSLSLDQIIIDNPKVLDVLGLGDFDMYDQEIDIRNIITVKGNNDYSNDLPYSLVRDYGYVKIFMTHGHKEGVTLTNIVLKKKALENNTQIVLYGHTHVAKIKFSDGIIYFNPGSIGYPRVPRDKTYGLIEITDSFVRFEIRYAYTNEIYKSEVYKLNGGKITEE